MILKNEARKDITKPNERHHYYPFAEINLGDMKTRGKYPGLYPEGAVIHYTASPDGLKTYQYSLKTGLCHFVIDEFGQVYQGFPLLRWGFHAGESMCPVTKRTSVSKYYVGIEVVCAGLLTKRLDSHGADTYETWFGSFIDKSHVMTFNNNRENIKAGTYHLFTPGQVATLESLITWLKWNCQSVFSFDHVFGHDEVSGPRGIGYWRKTDPGGSLGMTMDAFRTKLKQLFIGGDRWTPRSG